MKKLLPMCLFAAMSCGISNAQTIRMTELESENNLNYMYFGYDSENRVDSIYQRLSKEGYSTYRLFEYDASGNNVSVRRYQMAKEMDDFLYTEHVDYTYNENNKIMTRKNYNLDLWGGTDEFILGGVYVYEYDVNQNLSKRKLFWDEDLTRLYESIVYEYNSRGMLISDTRTTEQFGVMMEDFKEVYEYDAKDRLTKITYYALDYQTGKLAESNYRILKYDENDNLVETEDLLADKSVSERHEYNYRKDIESKDTTFPVNNEDDKTLYYASKNVIGEDVIYMLDVHSAELINIDTETWKYVDSNPSSGIADVKDAGMASIKSLDGNFLELGNVARGEQVRVFDASGSMLMCRNYGSGIDISSLPKGIYMIVTNGSSVKIRK